MSHIKYTDGMKRPKIEPTEIDVHKIVSQVQDGKNPTKIVDEYYASNGYLEERIDGLSTHEIHEKSDKEFPALTTEMVEECLEFADKNRDLIDSIIEEDQILKEVIFGGDMDARSIEERLDGKDFEYFNVEFERENDNYSINWDG